MEKSYNQRPDARSDISCRKVEAAAKEDLQVAKDLPDAFIAHREGCVGKTFQHINHKLFFDELRITAR